MPEKRRLIAHARQRNRALDLDASIGKDVMQLGAAITQHLADQESSVALRGPPTTAEQCDSTILRTLQQTLYRLLKGRLPRHLSVERVPFGVVVLVPLGTASERLPKEGIADPSIFHCPLKILPVEMRRKLRIGIRPNVDEQLDALVADKG